MEAIAADQGALGLTFAPIVRIHATLFTPWPRPNVLGVVCTRCRATSAQYAVWISEPALLLNS